MLPVLVVWTGASSSTGVIGQVERLSRDGVALAVVHVKGETVAGGVGAVVHVDQPVVVDVVLREAGDGHTRTGRQLQLAIGQAAGDRVGDTRGRLFAVGVE